jgi:hypothetical protein
MPYPSERMMTGFTNSLQQVQRLWVVSYYLHWGRLELTESLTFEFLLSILPLDFGLLLLVSLLGNILENY